MKTDGQIRPNYFDGECLNAEDLRLEQRYQYGALQTHNRTLHTWGIVSGLKLVKGIEPKTAVVLRGEALDSEGRSIVLMEDQVLQFKGLDRMLYVTLAFDEALTDYSDETKSAGYKRIEETPILLYSGQEPEHLGEQIILGQILFAGDGEVSEILLEERRNVGAAIGRVSFIIPGMPSKEWPYMEGFREGQLTGIEIDAPELRAAKDVTVEGNLAIGTDSPRATLDVVDTENRNGKDAIASFATQQDNAMVITADNSVGIGTETPQEALHIAQGNLGISDGRAIEGAASLNVINQSDASEISLDEVKGAMQFRQVGEIQFTIGDPSQSLAASMVVKKDGKVGIGVSDDKSLAPNLLTVNGMIHTTQGGLMFPDGTVQKTAAVSSSVPIGTVLEWWRPDPATPVPDGFEICSPPTNTQLNLPNLEGKFIRGTSDLDKVGDSGGSATHNHSLLIPDHVHSIDHEHPTVYPNLDESNQTSNKDTSPVGKCDPTGNKQVAWTYHTHTMPDLPVPMISKNSEKAVPNSYTIDEHANDPASTSLIMIIRVE